MNNELLYFNWLCSKVGAGPDVRYQNRHRLFKFLYEREFEWSVLLDRNRAADGLALRNEFGITLSKNANCLEVIIAIACRIEAMTNDPYAGDRTALWFCNMLKSLDVYDMEDIHFDSEACCIFIDNWLSRSYEPNGYGSLFTLVDCPKDARDMEIWEQVTYYINMIDI